jgi:hypothetical protein
MRVMVWISAAEKGCEFGIGERNMLGACVGRVLEEEGGREVRGSL